ncbi:inositol 5-phosphatase 4 [Planoprotostelium fungivorum]|uniref:Inositol 5-phosphatase 4 n=1 Tax=Planoprotostelium fungivorum TaxID=1890364 RepID=A0A2P6NC43_9EUKA|nr:inositol 5-phosphatase 4 [Planoprotostelium fungivorum]
MSSLRETQGSTAPAAQPTSDSPVEEQPKGSLEDNPTYQKAGESEPKPVDSELKHTFGKNSKTFMFKMVNSGLHRVSGNTRQLLCQPTATHPPRPSDIETMASDAPTGFKQIFWANSDINRESWTKNLLKSRESEFMEAKDLSIYFATWNVNGKKPGESLEGMLLSADYKPDLYAIGFQELDLSAENFLLGYTPNEPLWMEQIVNTLEGSGEKYILMETKRVVGVLLAVFVKESVRKMISEVQTGLANIGVMGMMGNKAGVAVRFNVYETSVCIVNSHLNAHTEGVLRRNQDFHDISRRITFNPPKGAGPEPLQLFQHDYVFWIGDLNYRITGNDQDIKQKIVEQDWDYLMSHDQLWRQIENKAAFDKLSEGPLRFAPTYKYDVGTNTYDTSEKMRTPAWCDRILYRGDNINQIDYRRHELLTSDHKPVTSFLYIKYKQVNPSLKQWVQQDIYRMLDRAVNESQPTAMLDQDELDFGQVRFGNPVCRTVCIKNTGKVVCKFKFIQKLNEATAFKPWIHINPVEAIMVQGTIVPITLTILVQKMTALELNLGKQNLSDILILSLENGNSFYLTIKGEWLPSCFGSLLTHLIRYPEPVRTSQPLPPDSENCLSIPKELWRIVDFLYRRGTDMENLFVEDGVESELDQIRHPHSMAQTLVGFLDSLAEPVIPYSYFDQLMECFTYNQCKNVIRSLTAVHYSTFCYIIAFLREYLSRFPRNVILREKLAGTFGKAMIRRRELADKMYAAPIGRKRTDIIDNFLNPENELNLGQKT